MSPRPLLRHPGKGYPGSSLSSPLLATRSGSEELVQKSAAGTQMVPASTGGEGEDCHAHTSVRSLVPSLVPRRHW